MVRNFFDLSGKTAVVLGATSGLGRAIAIGLAEAGADVVATGRRPDAVDRVTAEIEGLGRKSLRQPVDVTSRESLTELCERVEAELGGLSILVNAAGATLKKPSIELTDEDWNGLFEVNVGSIFKSCQVFYDPLKKAQGSILNIASLSSFLAFHQVAAYASSKTAVLGLTRSLACEWAPDNIRVNALIPGVFPTALNEKLLLGTARGAEILMRTPMGRFGSATEVVGAAVFFASDAASFVTGAALPVDGGYLASGVNS